MYAVATLLIVGVSWVTGQDTLEDAAGKSSQSKKQVITLTPNAAAQIKKAVRENELPADTLLRVKVLHDWARGFSYDMEFAKPADKTAQDREVLSHGILVIVDPKSSLYLDGTTIDYEQRPRAGYRFNNPNAVTPAK